jgi:hypothetical protein
MQYIIQMVISLHVDACSHSVLLPPAAVSMLCAQYMQERSSAVKTGNRANDSAPKLQVCAMVNHHFVCLYCVVLCFSAYTVCVCVTLYHLT